MRALAPRARPARLVIAALGLVTVLPFGRRYLLNAPLGASRANCCASST